MALSYFKSFENPWLKVTAHLSLKSCTIKAIIHICSINGAGQVIHQNVILRFMVWFRSLMPSMSNNETAHLFVHVGQFHLVPLHVRHELLINMSVAFFRFFWRTSAGHNKGGDVGKTHTACWCLCLCVSCSSGTLSRRHKTCGPWQPRSRSGGRGHDL